VYQVLLALIAKHGHVVTREELKQALWPSDTHVNFDANVNTTVNKLRQIWEIPQKDRFTSRRFRAKGTVSSLSRILDATISADCTNCGEWNPATKSALGDAGQAEKHSDRWVTFGVIALILAGILLGAGIATFWISRWAPH